MSEKLDVLDREKFINNLVTLIDTLSASGQGCCFAVNGNWGSGKSFVLEKVEQELLKKKTDDTEDYMYYVFHYDCWKYDYYAEPSIAVISAMLDATAKELEEFPEGVENAMKYSLEMLKKTLNVIAGELCKNKIGIDLVEIASDVLEEGDKEGKKIKEFDALYGFKRALENTRTNMQEIAKDKTVVIIVDELDRCLPEYAIKVLERLHHIFVNLDNVIMIISMDKKQLEHSIKGIFGDIEVDAYLRKIISFKIELDNGFASNYREKYESYFSMFDIPESECRSIEGFCAEILSGLDIRTQERIFRKAEIIHSIIKQDEKNECSIMTFEILYLTIALRQKHKNLEWLCEIWLEHNPTKKKQLGENYYQVLYSYGNDVCSSVQKDGAWVINNTWVAKTFFWLTNLYSGYWNGYCGRYYCDTVTEADVKLVRRFSKLVEIIESD